MPANQVSQTTQTSIDPKGFRDEVVAACKALRLRQGPPPEPVCERLRGFCQLLLQWNGSLNLTGAKAWKDVVNEHLPDAFVLAEEVPEGARVVDVGSGGGLPALPLCLIRPDLTVYMLEPRAKRVAFLRTAVREFGLKGFPVVCRDDEWDAPDGGVHVAISRATFAPAEWVARGRRLVSAGHIFAFLTAESPADLPAGGEGRDYELPGGQKRRLVRFSS